MGDYGFDFSSLSDAGTVGDLGGSVSGFAPAIASGADFGNNIASAGAGIDWSKFLGGLSGSLSGALPTTAQGYLGLGATGLALGTGIAGLTAGESASERRLRQLAEAQQAQSNALTAETAPLRAQATQMIMAALDPNTQVNVSPARDALERQFKVARNRTIEGSTARGGQLASELTGLEENRAVGVANLEGAARDQALSQALQVGFGVGPSAASQSTNAALGAFSNLNQVATQRQAAAGAATGQAAAMATLLAMKGSK